jgi:hypothetical protein
MTAPKERYFSTLNIVGGRRLTLLIQQTDEKRYSLNDFQVF